MFIIPALAVAAAALPTAIERRCVAVIATVAYEQARGRWKAAPPVAKEGGEYAAIIGARLIDEAGMTREQAAQVFRDEAAAFTTRPFETAEAQECVALMQATLAAQPLPEPVK